MRQKRLAVLGLCGGALIVVTALGIWIQRLEQRVAVLERTASARVAVAPAVPDVPVQSSPNWKTSDKSLADNGITIFYDNPPAHAPLLESAKLPNGSRLPQGTTTHEINGLTYYVMPLGHGSNVPRVQ